MACVKTRTLAEVNYFVWFRDGLCSRLCLFSVVTAKAAFDGRVVMTRDALGMISTEFAGAIRCGSVADSANGTPKLKR